MKVANTRSQNLQEANSVVEVDDMHLLPSLEVLRLAHWITRPIDRFSGSTHDLSTNPLIHVDSCATGACELPHGLIKGLKSFCVKVVQS